jgi:hypothetical protein
MEYQIVLGDMVDLQERVNTLIRLGWRPIGGIATSGQGRILFYQAMVRES